MATYLFTWNPKSWEWTDLEQASDSVKNGKRDIKGRWSCGNTKKIKINDRFFLLKQGGDLPTGIFGSGRITKAPFPDLHWEEARSERGEEALYVGISFDRLLNPETDNIIEREFLQKDAVFSTVNWNTQRSGIEIYPEVALELEQVWSELNDGVEFILPDEVRGEIFEGGRRSVLVNAYERNIEARQICIEHYGNCCIVCKFDFDDGYGQEIANGYIHVHHLVPLSEIGEVYVVDPIKDLVPVCPNCHAIIHKRRPPYSIAEMKKIIHKNRQK